MNKTTKIRLSVWLSILMIMPTILGIVPMASTEVLAAGNSVSISWNWPYFSSSGTAPIEVESGQQFYIGDYVEVYTNNPKSYNQATASMVKASYSSSNASVATVNSKGYLTAKGNGTTTITVKYKGKKIACKIKVVPAGTFVTSEDTAAVTAKAAEIAQNLPAKITTKNGFRLYKLQNEYSACVADSKEVNSRGFLFEPGEEDSLYPQVTPQLAVPQAGRHLTLNTMLDDYTYHNNPTSTRSAKPLSIKSVSANRNGITIQLKDKVTLPQILAARIYGSRYYSYLGNEKLSGTTKAYVNVYVIDTKSDKWYYCKAELNKGSTTMKLVPYRYVSKSGEYIQTKLTKGRTYRLEYKTDWTKGKTVTVK